MNQMIGFDRKIQLAWLDSTVGLCQQRLAPDCIAKNLKQKLASEIAGAEARRKTVTVLLRLWVNVPEKDVRLRDEALTLAAQVRPDERLWLYWGMSLLAYPFFRDVAATIGQIGRLQTVWSLAQIQRRMVEEWGQRTTLQRAVQRLARTFYNWGMIQEAEGKGNYIVKPARQITQRALGLWLLECALHAHNSEQLLLREFVQLPYLFPLDLSSFINDVRLSERFEVTHQGLDMEMVTAR
jgi:hypothetical protein